MLTALLLTVAVLLTVLALFISSAKTSMNESEGEFNVWDEDLKAARELQDLAKRCKGARGIRQNNWLES